MVHFSGENLLRTVRGTGVLTPVKCRWFIADYKPTNISKIWMSKSTQRLLRMHSPPLQFKVEPNSLHGLFHHFSSKEFSFVLIQSEDFFYFFFIFIFLFYTPSRRVHFHKHCTPHKSLQTTVTCEGNLKWAEHLNHDSLCNGLYMLCVREKCLAAFLSFLFFF